MPFQRMAPGRVHSQMQIFAIFAVNQPDVIKSQVEVHFPDEYMDLDHNAFLVACRGKTTQEVADLCGLNDESSGMLGIITPIETYWGLHLQSVWEWMRDKGRQP